MLMKLMMVIRLYSVDVSYPPGLEDLINAFKLCATVRLFLQVIILSYFSYFFYIHTKFCWCGCKNIGIGNRQLANKHFQTFISFLENFTNGTRTFFLTLMLEFSSTLMRWFSKTRPSFGTGSFSLDNKNLSSNKQISSFYTVHRPGHRPRWSTLQQRPGRWFSYVFLQLQKTLLPSRKPTSPIMACPDSVLMQGWLWWTWPGESQ